MRGLLRSLYTAHIIYYAPPQIIKSFILSPPVSEQEDDGGVKQLQHGGHGSSTPGQSHLFSFRGNVFERKGIFGTDGPSSTLRCAPQFHSLPHKDNENAEDFIEILFHISKYSIQVSGQIFEILCKMYKTGNQWIQLISKEANMLCKEKCIFPPRFLKIQSDIFEQCF